MKIVESIILKSKDSGAEFLKMAKEAIELLISTPEGTVPLDRRFGLNQSFLSKSPLTVKTLFAQELISKAEMYIPEISISEIDYRVDVNGNAQPIVTVCKNTEYKGQEIVDVNFNTDEDNYYYDEDDPDSDTFVTNEVEYYD